MTDRLIFLLLRLGLGLVGMLPAQAISPLGRLVGSVWYSVDRSRRHMSRRHLRRVLGRAPTPTEVKAMFRSYGRYWAETLWFRPGGRLDRLRARTVVENVEHLRDALAEGHGCVVALPHTGNWELAAPITWDLDSSVVAVAESLGNPHLTNWFTSLRAELGIEVVLAGRRAIPALQDGLARGKVVTLLCDRDLSGKGATVEFFGEATTIPTGPVRLAQAERAPLVAAACYFEDGGHRVVITPRIEVSDCSVEEGVRRVVEKLEGLIRRNPTQWHILQPNWPSDRERPE